MRHKHSVTEDPLKIVGIAAVAASIGAIVAMLVTPRSGGQVRSGLKRRASHLKDEVHERFDHVSDEFDDETDEASQNMQAAAEKAAAATKAKAAKAADKAKTVKKRGTKPTAKPATTPRRPQK